MKKKILLVNESSLLSTGYSNYGREILRFFSQNPDYEIAELASFSDGSDKRISTLPWKHFPAKVKHPNFDSDSLNKWGKFVFDDVCLAYRPHFVIDVRDWWNFEWQSRSPARKYFHWGVLAPVDSIPQKEEWLSTFASADGVLTFTDWGTKVLQEEIGSGLKSFGAAPHCVCPEFFPKDRASLRKKFGIGEDFYIFGAVMRNQPRKLYPDMIDSFAHYLETAPKEIASKTYMYFHTAYPDVAWKLPKLIKNAGISSRVYFTYKCTSCKKCYPSFYHGSRIICKYCCKNDAILPGWNEGVELEDLCNIYNLMDCLVQYSTCEGFGIPQIEAAACGIPVFAVDYSAMSEVVRRVGGTPLKVQRMAHDVGTESIRALPDNNDLVEKLTSFFIKSQSVRQNMGYKTEKLVRQNYDWKNTVQAWMNFFESIPENRLDKWNSRAMIHMPNLNVPPNLSETDFVNWCVVNVAGRPDLVNSFLCSKLSRDLYHGRFIDGASEFGGESAKFSSINRKIVLNYFINMCEQSNQFERKRESK